MSGAFPWQRRIAIGVLALLPVLAVLAVLTWRSLFSSSAPASGEQPPADSLAHALDRALQRSTRPLPPGLAIRPLNAADAHPELQAVAESVCESLSGALVRLRTLRVASCASTRTALAAESDDRGLAQLLRVNYVITGRLDSGSEGRLRVQLELLDLRQRQPRWNMDEEMALGALQALPARVVSAAAQAIGEPAPDRDDPTLDPDLYASMLRATRMARRPSPAERREALAIVERVLAAAPDHVPAQYMRLALLSQLGQLPGVPANAGAAEIRAAQERLRAEVRALGQSLVEADPGDWRGNILLINDALMHRRWGEALDRADTVLQHAHNHPGLLRIAARVNLHAGYVRRAQALALDAARIDALDAEAFGVLVLTHGMGGDDTGMRELLAIAQQLGHRQLELPRLIDARRRGDRTAVERTATGWTATGRTDAPAPDWAAPWIAALVNPTHRDAAVLALHGASDADRLRRAGFLVEYALIDERDSALRALEELTQRPVGPWIQHLWWPELATLRSDLRFVQALNDLRLIELWNVRGAPDVCERGADGGWTCR